MNILIDIIGNDMFDRLMAYKIYWSLHSDKYLITGNLPNGIKNDKNLQYSLFNYLFQRDGN